jgi:hypothetical protein
MGDGITALNSSITLDHIKRVFSMSITDPSTAGSYKIIVTGTLGSYSSKSFTFILNIVCKISTLTPGIVLP